MSEQNGEYTYNRHLISLKKEGHADECRSEDPMLSEASQSQMDKYCGVHFHEIPGAVNFTETESRRVVNRGWRKEGSGGKSLVCTVFQFGGRLNSSGDGW